MIKKLLLAVLEFIVCIIVYFVIIALPFVFKSYTVGRKLRVRLARAGLFFLLNSRIVADEIHYLDPGYVLRER